MSRRDNQLADDMITTLKVLVFFFIAAVALAFLAGCAEQPTITRNVERTTTNTVVVPKPVACFRIEELPPLPGTTVVAEPAQTDQLAAAAAADREALHLYATAVDAMLKRCAAVK